MGTHKALVPVDGIPMARRVADALLAAGADRAILVGGDPGWGPRLGLGRVPDRWPGEGPLGGLATALLDVPAHPESIVLVAACDQPWLDGPSVADLAEALRQDRGAGAALATGQDGRRQPFPSAWRPSAGGALGELVTAGHRRADAAFSLVRVLDIALPGAILDDVDWPSDLARWEDGLPSVGGLVGLDP